MVRAPLAAEMSNCAPAPARVTPLDWAMLPLIDKVSRPPAMIVVAPV